MPRSGGYNGRWGFCFMKKSFVLHIDSLDILPHMEKEDVGELFLLIYKFNTKQEFEVPSHLKLVWIPFLNQFKRDAKKYEAVADRNKINGFKGGRPKNPVEPKETQKTQVVFQKPKKADSDSVSDSVNDSESVSVSDSKKDLKHPLGVSGLENSVHHQIIKIHSDFYAQKNDGLKYRFQAAADGKAVKEIVEYLRTAKAPPKSPNEIIFAWEWILSNYDKWDSFHQKRLKLTQINSELPNIISIIKNGKSNSKNRTNGQSPDDAVAQSVRVAEMLRGDNDKRH